MGNTCSLSSVCSLNLCFHKHSSRKSACRPCVVSWNFPFSLHPIGQRKSGNAAREQRSSNIWMNNYNNFHTLFISVFLVNKHEYLDSSYLPSPPRTLPYSCFHHGQPYTCSCSPLMTLRATLSSLVPHQMLDKGKAGTDLPEQALGPQLHWLLWLPTAPSSLPWLTLRAWAQPPGLELLSWPFGPTPRRGPVLVTMRQLAATMGERQNKDQKLCDHTDLLCG